MKLVQSGPDGALCCDGGTGGSGPSPGGGVSITQHRPCTAGGLGTLSRRPGDSNKPDSVTAATRGRVPQKVALEPSLKC